MIYATKKYANVFLAVTILFTGCKFEKKKQRNEHIDPIGIEAPDQDVTLPESFFKPVNLNPTKTICSTDENLKQDLPVRRLSDAYLNNCSGCHGSAGEGLEEFPTLRGKNSVESYIATVRSGGTRMPGFSVGLIADDDLRKDFEMLAASDDIETIDTRFDFLSSTVAFDETSYADAMRSGLNAWRIPGERGACQSCHGPDAIDLAAIDYSRSAILRRSLGQGLPHDKALAIVTMVEAQRWRYGISAPCKSASFIPLQPGHSILAGKSGLEKDLALFNALQGFKISLGLTNINSETAGNPGDLIDALAKLNVHSLPITIALNAWTQDAFHGGEHRSTAEWIPEIPLEPNSSEAKLQWDQLQNRYIQEPTTENFWLLVDGVSLLATARFGGGGVSERLAREKYKSVLLFQHMLRLGEFQMPDLAKTKNLNRFSVWETAQVASVMARGCAETGSDAEPFPCWKYPASFFKKMGSDRENLLSDVLGINLSWLVAGWILDPGLQLTEGGDAQIQHLHDAMEKHQDRGGVSSQIYNQLPLHDIYFSAIRLSKSIETPDLSFPVGPRLDQKAQASCWNYVGQGLGQWITATLPHLELLLDPERKPVIDDKHKALVIEATTAVNRSILHKIKQHLAKKSDTCQPIEYALLPLNEAVNKILLWHAKDGRSDAMVGSVVDEIHTLLK